MKATVQRKMPKTWHVANPTDKDITVGLHVGSLGYVVALDRLKRVVHVSKQFEPFGTTGTEERSFDWVLAQFPNGIHFAEY